MPDRGVGDGGSGDRSGIVIGSNFVLSGEKTQDQQKCAAEGDSRPEARNHERGRRFFRIEQGDQLQNVRPSVESTQREQQGPGGSQYDSECVHVCKSCLCWPRRPGRQGCHNAKMMKMTGFVKNTVTAKRLNRRRSCLKISSFGSPLSLPETNQVKILIPRNKSRGEP